MKNKSRQVENAKRIKQYAIDNKCSILKAQSDLGFGKYYFNDVIKAIQSGLYCSDGDKNFLLKYKKEESTTSKVDDIYHVDGFKFTSKDYEDSKTTVTEVVSLKDTTAITLKAFTELNESSIAEASGYDLKLYDISVKSIKFYQVAMKIMVNEIGSSKPVEKPHIATLYSIKAEVSKKKVNLESIDLPSWINDIKPVKLNHTFNYKDDGRMLHIPIFDLHFGKRSSAYEDSGKWVDKVINIINKSLIHSKYISKITKVLLVFGGDTFNYDGIHGGTTKGTVQENQMGFKQMITEFVKEFKSVVDFISKYYSIDIVMIPGNHDHNTSVTMATILEQMYKDTNVRVNKAIGNKTYIESLSGTRMYYLRGDVLFQIHHGDVDVKRVANLIKHEAKSFYVKANKIYSDYGHLHFVKTKKEGYAFFDRNNVIENDGVLFRQHNSISLVDGWHDRNGYIGSGGELSGEIVCSKKGIIDVYISEDGK